jgi:hypothetical protein
MRWLKYVEKLVEIKLAEETVILGENTPCHNFSHYKSHMTSPGTELGTSVVESR